MDNASLVFSIIACVIGSSGLIGVLTIVFKHGEKSRQLSQLESSVEKLWKLKASSTDVIRNAADIQQLHEKIDEIIKSELRRRQR